MADPEDPKVGYKAPPLHTRFQPGQSGNKNGRPKQLQEFSDLVLDELFQDIKIKEGNKTTKASKFSAAFKQFLQAALKGDPKAMLIVLKFIELTGAKGELTGKVNKQKMRDGRYFK